MTVTLSESEFRRVILSANLAPSVHNTQPTRWQLGSDGAISLFLDDARTLPIGDPEGRDARLSCGAALEGTRLALSELGLRIRSLDQLPETGKTDLSRLLRLEIGRADAEEPLACSVQRRFTWRGGFSPANDKHRRQIADIADQRNDMMIACEANDIAGIADMNDEASLKFFMNRPYREELLHWMRLSPRHPCWSIDGLNADALGMNRLEAVGAGLVLRSPVFELLQSVRLAGSLVSEKSKTKTAAAILLFHRPIEEDPLDSGVAFYRLLLSLADRDFSAWPMAVLADDPDWRAELSERFAVESDRRLINVLRVGPVPNGAKPNRARIDPGALIV